MRTCPFGHGISFHNTIHLFLEVFELKRERILTNETCNNDLLSFLGKVTHFRISFLDLGPVTDDLKMILFPNDLINQFTLVMELLTHFNNSSLLKCKMMGFDEHFIRRYFYFNITVFCWVTMISKCEKFNSTNEFVMKNYPGSQSRIAEDNFNRGIKLECRLV